MLVTYSVPKMAFSVEDMLAALGISRPTLYKEIKAGRLQTYTIRGRRFASEQAIREYQKYLEAQDSPLREVKCGRGRR